MCLAKKFITIKIKNVKNTIKENSIMKKKFRMLITVIMASVLVLSGCGNSTASAPSNSNQNPTVEETATPSAKTSPAPKATVLQEHIITMYSADGRTRETKESEVKAYQKVGWYSEPVRTMYSADGRTIIIKTSETKSYEKVNWYTEPVCTIYAPDGRTTVVKKDESDAYKNVGWYTTAAAAKKAAPHKTTAKTSSSSRIASSKVSSSPITDDKSQTVYITRTGKKYHRSGCRYLSRSCNSISLSSAKSNGYSACSVCNPPQ